MELASKTNTSIIHNKHKALYMTFAEQKLLADLAIQEQVKVGTVVKNIMSCESGDFGKVLYKRGLDELVESEKYMVHFGSFKSDLKKENKFNKRVINHINFLFNKYNINFKIKKSFFGIFY